MRSSSGRWRPWRVCGDDGGAASETMGRWRYAEEGCGRGKGMGGGDGASRVQVTGGRTKLLLIICCHRRQPIFCATPRLRSGRGVLLALPDAARLYRPPAGCTRLCTARDSARLCPCSALAICQPRRFQPYVLSGCSQGHLDPLAPCTTSHSTCHPLPAMNVCPLVWLQTPGTITATPSQTFLPPGVAPRPLSVRTQPGAPRKTLVPAVLRYRPTPSTRTRRIPAPSSVLLRLPAVLALFLRNRIGV